MCDKFTYYDINVYFTNYLCFMQSFPVLVGELDPSGNLNAQVIHAFSKKIKAKAIMQVSVERRLRDILNLRL